MKSFLFKVENAVFKNRSECQFDLQKSQHILILPGLGGSVWDFFALVRFLRKHQSQYAVTAIPLGLNTTSISVTVPRTIEYLQNNLFNKTKPEKIIFIGHSIGGRVTCMLVNEIKNIYPDVSYGVVTLGSPVGVGRRKYFPHFIDTILGFFSDAYREWVPIIQPDPTKIQYTGYYSVDDKIIPSAEEKGEHKGTVIEVKGLSHMDFLDPKKIGNNILQLLNQKTQL